MKKPATKSVTADAPVCESGEGVAAVERALFVVAALEDSDQPMMLAELAVRTGFYMSTILRHLGSLMATGYVMRRPTGSYDLGLAFRLGVAFTRKIALATLDRVEAGHSYALLHGAAGHIILVYHGSTGARNNATRAHGFDVSLGERDPSCAAVAAALNVLRRIACCEGMV